MIANVFHVRPISRDYLRENDETSRLVAILLKNRHRAEARAVIYCVAVAFHLIVDQTDPISTKGIQSYGTKEYSNLLYPFKEKTKFGNLASTIRISGILSGNIECPDSEEQEVEAFDE